MKITKLEEFHVDCGWEIYSFLKISTDEGLSGWSEFREHRRPGIAAAIHGMGELVLGQDPRAIGRLEAALYSFTRSVPGGLNQNAAGAILNACLDIKGKALGVPVYELFGGAVRERIPVYWSRCGVIRARCAEYFDGKVIDAPAVRTVDDLKVAAREARERGYQAIKVNLLVFDKNGGRQYTPGSSRGPGHPELNLPEDMLDALIAQRGRPQFQLQSRGLPPHRQEGRAVRPDVARDGYVRAGGACPHPTINHDPDRVARDDPRPACAQALSRGTLRRRRDHRSAI
jgi:L-alanine-DL-glutamate epimerase-like enolase superfamily enzyme